MPETRLIDVNEVCLIESDSDAYIGEWNDDYEKGFDDAIHKVMELPTVDAVPVKRACWTENKYGEIVCSRCGEYALIDYDDYSFLHKVRVNYSDYCSNCGADMRGEVDDRQI